MPNWNVEHWQLAVSAGTLAGIVVIAVAVLWGMTHSRRRRTGGSESRDWIRTLQREKAIVRSLFTQAVAFVAILGFQPDTEIILAIEGFAVTVAALWIRVGVTPVDDPDPAVIERFLDA